jgi:chromatin segregation and condensation protein Rec8/ScpA/Scc1 (kleisin family)
MTPDPASLPVAQGVFGGPLDLLLEAVRTQRVAIQDVAMAPLVASFLSYFRGALARNIDLGIEWLQMAATLIHWKSRSLLPSDPENPAADPIRDSLVQQLMAHHKALSLELQRFGAHERGRFARAHPVPPDPSSEWLTVWDMLQEARSLAEWAERHRAVSRRVISRLDIDDDATSIAEMSGWLRSYLVEDAVLDGYALMADLTDVSRRSCLFLGMLEMARAGEIRMEQTETWGPIRIQKITLPTVGNVPAVGHATTVDYGTTVG